MGVYYSLSITGINTKTTHKQELCVGISQMELEEKVEQSQKRYRDLARVLGFDFYLFIWNI